MTTGLPDLPEIAVSCRGVSKSFGAGAHRTSALDSIDLDIPAGQITFLVGPSGCGKTTLISAIGGILETDAGSIEVFGTDVGRLSAGAAARFRSHSVGFVLQQFHLLPALTATENVAVPLIVAGHARSDAMPRATELLCEVGLERQARRFPEELSTGQQQRIAIARALVHDPRLVICDEPTAALDAASGAEVVKLLERCALRPDRAVIIVTHDMRILEDAENIVSMSDGRIIGQTIGPRSEAA